MKVFDRPKNTIHFELKKEFAWLLRIVFFILAFISLFDLYEALTSGIADAGRVERIKGEDVSFYTFASKKLFFAIIFLWLAIFSICKKRDPNSGDS